MFSSAELIEALQRRTRRSIRPPPPPGEWPAGWRDWFAAMAGRPGRVTGATVAEVIAAAAGRMPALPVGIARELGPWRAFATLWRQGPQPASEDERWTRIASMSASLLLHVLFVVALVWLMLFRFQSMPSPEDAREGEEHVLQVEYIGEGSPLESGGGAPDGMEDAPPATAAQPSSEAAGPAAPSAPASRPEAVADRASPAPDVAPAAPADPPPVPDPEPLVDIQLPPPREPVVDIPEPRPTTVPVPDVLQVTEVAVPDSRFVVPPPREPSVSAPELAASPVRVPERTIELGEADALAAPPAPAAPSADVAPVRVPAPGVAPRSREIELAEARDVRVAPAPGVPDIDVPSPAVADVPTVAERALPTPSARPAPATADAASDAGRQDRAATGTARETATAAAPGGRPEAGAGAREPGAPPGAGLLPEPPGAPPSGRLSDEWGDSTRDAAGRQAGRPGGAGLFNSDGSPRLADGGAVGGGLPPGTITEDFEKIDRHGTWLKRPPYDYEPTAFDRFWMPSETLLEEWVRRSVTEVRIPIPGTTKTIRCVTVLLAVGGACDIVDPNLQEQPAAARPPPDVPFKPELQEARDAMRPPAGD